MIYLGRHHVRSSTAAVPPCRRTPSRRAAVLMAAAGATVLLAAGHPPTQAYAGAPATRVSSATGVASATRVAPAATVAGPDRVVTPDPTGPDSGAAPVTDSPWTQPDTRFDPYPRRPDGSFRQDGNPPAWPGFAPDLNLGYDPDNPALRGPQAGSQPSVAPPAPTYGPTAAPIAEQRTDRWDFLNDTATGEMLFLSGFLLLLLCIGGLVTVGLYRRRW